MLANIVEKWCLRGWYKNQKIPDLCGGAEQLHPFLVPPSDRMSMCSHISAREQSSATAAL
ncbi:hypothetical protein MJO57_10575 [Endozoicomonas sp. SCSIO W0465]|nr:hypothetical protein [Endozoicomonas sp. SCSIO W0465]USE38566.1 hypothetical protein MJO57_10575 [Endozoicomonas sp. SCSIO W0465]